ncbi:hypothetical protein M0R45_030793 [Rubus argutus]|uniref:Uncharacterized protein n=1 Tax=Rubus argutus TaxID=59490 RepID=A0AAW1WEA1_RUBAR
MIEIAATGFWQRSSRELRAQGGLSNGLGVAMNFTVVVNCGDDWLMWSCRGGLKDCHGGFKLARGEVGGLVDVDRVIPDDQG